MSLLIELKQPLTKDQTDQLRLSFRTCSSHYTDYMQYEEGTTQLCMEIDDDDYKMIHTFRHVDVQHITNAILASKLEIAELTALYFEEDQNSPYARTIYRDGELIYQHARIEWDDESEEDKQKWEAHFKELATNRSTLMKHLEWKANLNSDGSDTDGSDDDEQG